MTSKTSEPSETFKLLERRHRIFRHDGREVFVQACLGYAVQ